MMTIRLQTISSTLMDLAFGSRSLSCQPFSHVACKRKPPASVFDRENRHPNDSPEGCLLERAERRIAEHARKL